MQGKVIHPIQMRERKKKDVGEIGNERIEEITDLLPKASLERSLDHLNKEAKKVLKKASNNFVWLRMEAEKIWKLHMLEREGDKDSVLIPWFKVKETIKNDKQTKYLYGLFALRDFDRGSITSAYLGIFCEKGSGENPFAMMFTDDIVIDIPKKGDERLHYGMGAHMMND